MKPLPEDELPKEKTSFTEIVAGVLSVGLIVAFCLYGCVRLNEDMQGYRDVIMNEFKSD